MKPWANRLMLTAAGATLVWLFGVALAFCCVKAEPCGDRRDATCQASLTFVMHARRERGVIPSGRLRSATQLS